MCQRRSRCVDDDLADRFCTERTSRLVAAPKLDAQLAHIEAGRQFILHKRIIDHLTLVRVLDTFKQRHADALHQTALDLYARKVRVDDGSAVDNGGIIENLDLAGLFIQLDLDRTSHIRRRRYR